MIGNVLGQWLRDMCECCWADCDCGCIDECPRHKSADL